MDLPGANPPNRVVFSGHARGLSPPQDTSRGQFRVHPPFSLVKTSGIRYIQGKLNDRREWVRMLRAIRRMGFLIFLGFMGTAGAATYVIPPDDFLVRESPVIVRARVRSVHVARRGEAFITEIELRTLETLRGTAPEQFILRQPGGAIGDEGWVVPGLGDYRAGEEVLLFLVPGPSGTYRPWGWGLGKFTIRRRPDGRRVTYRDALLKPGALVLPGPRGDREIPRDLDRFLEYIRAVAAGKPVRPSYALPGGISEAESTPPPAFVLFQPPARRYEFDTGSVTYRIDAGGDDSCSGGCLTEALQGAGKWNPIPGTRIQINPATGNVGNTCFDQLHDEINFNDPCDDIPGSFNCAVGGTLAIGGYYYNGVTEAWNCPQRGTLNAHHITRAGITVQDGAGCISSCDYTTMIAHETGHTIGFDHSQYSDQLMSAVLVNGICGNPQSDDIEAALCLYNIPCGLGSFASASPPDGGIACNPVTLTWDPVDNAESYDTYLDGNLACSQRDTPDCPLGNLTGGSHTWWVVARDACGATLTSPTWSFWADTPEVPSGLTPADGAFVCTSTVTFDWNDSGGAESYTLVLDGVSHCANTSSSQCTVAGVAAGDHAWKVKAANTCGSVTGAESSFYEGVPGAPTLVSPQDGGVVCGDASLTWAAAPGAVSYDVFLDGSVTCAGVTNPPCDVTGLADGWHSWYVVAHNPCGDGTSVTWDFYSGPPSPPAGLQPPDGAAVANPVNLAWDAAAGARTYNVYLDGGLICTATAHEYCAAGTLTQGMHDWFVEAVNPCATASSPTFTMNVTNLVVRDLGLADTNGNGVLEPGEIAVWRPVYDAATGNPPAQLSGTLNPAPFILLLDSLATYGPVPLGFGLHCGFPPEGCYQFQVDAAIAPQACAVTQSGRSKPDGDSTR